MSHTDPTSRFGSLRHMLAACWSLQHRTTRLRVCTWVAAYYFDITPSIVCAYKSQSLRCCELSCCRLSTRRTCVCRLTAGVDVVVCNVERRVRRYFLNRPREFSRTHDGDAVQFTVHFGGAAGEVAQFYVIDFTPHTAVCSNTRTPHIQSRLADSETYGSDDDYMRGKLLLLSAHRHSHSLRRLAFTPTQRATLLADVGKVACCNAVTNLRCTAALIVHNRNCSVMFLQ